MKKKKLTLLAGILFVFWQTVVAQSLPLPVIPDDFKNHELDHNGLVIPYRLLTPATDRQDQKFPLIVALHGMENFGAKRHQFLSIAGGYALGWLSPSIQEKYPSYVVAPHLYYPLLLDEGYSGWESEKSLDFLRQLIDKLLATENIDPDRIYLTGHSVGGIGTFLVPKHLKDYFAALIPMNTAGGCPEVCNEVDDKLYDSLSVWGVHHRGDDANSNVRAVFTRLESLGREVYPTHSFGDQIINLPPTRIEELIDEHQRYFHTEYRYSCNGDRLFCHTSATDTILQDTLFQKWLFRQHKIDPQAIAITSVDNNDTNGNYTINWEVKDPADSVEVWFRSSSTAKWLMLARIVAAKKSFDLLPSVKRTDININSKVRTVVLNNNNFVYGFSESKITQLITGIPKRLKNQQVATFPNPVTHTLHLGIPDELPLANLTYSIVSPEGATIRSGSAVEKAIPVTGISAGIYVIILQSDTWYSRQKLVITKL